MPSSPPRLSILVVLSSSNQLYSGIGRHLFATCEALADRVEFAFAIDEGEGPAPGLLRAFADRHGMRIHAGKSRRDPDALDAYHGGLGPLVRSSGWDAIECLCWANAGTNARVLDAIDNRMLIYTPHDQPLDSVPMSSAQRSRTGEVHRAMLRRSDLTFCDSPEERRRLSELANPDGVCLDLPIGCRLDLFRPGTLERRRQLLFVGDLAEPRKRFDRALRVVARLRLADPGLRLLLVGNRSVEAREGLPEEVRGWCEAAGYVDDARLAALYRESLGLILLSDCEAFGVPIVEALASGTPVFLSDLPEMRGLFGDLPAVHLCPSGDAEATFGVIRDVLADPREAIRRAIATRSRVEARFDPATIADRRWRAIVAERFRKQRWPAVA